MFTQKLIELDFSETAFKLTPTLTFTFTWTFTYTNTNIDNYSYTNIYIYSCNYSNVYIYHWRCEEGWTEGRVRMADVHVKRSSEGNAYINITVDVPVCPSRPWWLMLTAFWQIRNLTVSMSLPYVQALQRKSKDQRWPSALTCLQQVFRLVGLFFLPVKRRLTEDVLFGQAFCSCELHQLLHHLKLPIITCPVYKVKISTVTSAALNHTLTHL